MQRGDRNAEHAEALKALTGIYPSTFFAAVERPISAEEAEWTERQKRLHPEIIPAIHEGQRIQKLDQHELWAWFRRPPGRACTIEWSPKRNEDADAILPKLQAGGTMIEFLLPPEALRPVLVIRPTSTLQAIAAAIYADHFYGIEYRTCEFCKRLFPVGTQKSKRFCNQSKCKNAAHSRNVRERKREEKTQSKSKKRVPKNLVTTGKAKEAASTSGKRPQKGRR